MFARRAAEVLTAAGVAATVVRSDGAPIRARLRVYRQLLGSDVMLNIGGRSELTRSQRVLIWCGLPMIVHWAGTDVIKRGHTVGPKVARRVWNWAVAPWLSEELSNGSGLHAEVVSLPWGPIPPTVPDLPETFTVLAYTPYDRRMFYGIDFILALARRLEDVRFDLLAIGTEAGFSPNVHTLGWVDDMSPVLERATVLVRPVQHDGMSNMVLEALGHGRYVLWTYPLPGVHRITSLDDAEAYIRSLVNRQASGSLAPNHVGRATIDQVFHPDVVARRMRLRLEQVARSRWRVEPHPIRRRSATTVLRVLRVLFRVPPAHPPGSQVGRSISWPCLSASGQTPNTLPPGPHPAPGSGPSSR